jgi:hypothetical protein
LISEVVQGQLKSGKITREQLVAHAFLLLVAGAWAPEALEAHGCVVSPLLEYCVLAVFAAVHHYEGSVCRTPEVGL